MSHGPLRFAQGQWCPPLAVCNLHRPRMSPHEGLGTGGVWGDTIGPVQSSEAYGEDAISPVQNAPGCVEMPSAPCRVHRPMGRHYQP